MKFKCRLKGGEKIRCELKSGEEKDYNVSTAVYEYVGKSFKKGDFVDVKNTEFEKKDGVVTIKSIKKYQKQQGNNTTGGNNNYQKKSSYSKYDNNNNARQVSIIRQVIFKKAVELVAAGNTQFGTQLEDVYTNMKRMFGKELMGTGNLVFEGKPEVEKKSQQSPVKEEIVDEEPEVDEPEEAIEEEEYN